MNKRYITAPQQSNGSWIVSGKQIIESLKHLHGFVQFDGCLIWVRDLREFAYLYEQDFFEILKEDSYLSIKTQCGQSRFWDRDNLPTSPPTRSHFATEVWNLSRVYGKCRPPKPPSGIIEFVNARTLW